MYSKTIEQALYYSGPGSSWITDRDKKAGYASPFKKLRPDDKEGKSIFRSFK